MKIGYDIERAYKRLILYDVINPRVAIEKRENDGYFCFLQQAISPSMGQFYRASPLAKSNKEVFSFAARCR